MNKTKLRWCSISFKQIALVFFAISFFVLHTSCKSTVTNSHNTSTRIEKQYNVEDTNSKTIDFKMILIECATATLGSETQNDNREHTIKLNSYWIGETEVTQGLWKAVMQENLSYFDGSDEEDGAKKPSEGEVQAKRPAEWVTWYECIAFCNELTKKMNEGDDSECVYTVSGHAYNIEDADNKLSPQMNMKKRDFAYQQKQNGNGL